MKFTHIIGIDVSKKTIDIALSQNKANASMINHKFTNNLKGYRTLVAWCKKQEVKLDQVLIRTLLFYSAAFWSAPANLA